MKERTAMFKVKVPVTFTFTATESVDTDKLFKMAEAYFELHLRAGMVDYEPMDLEIIDKKVNYTKEELEEADRYWEKLLGKPLVSGR